MRESMRRLPALVLLMTSLAACGGDDDGGAVGPIAATVTHYDYRFDIESRAAHATVTGTVTTAGDCWTLPLRARALDTATILLDGAPVTSGAVADDQLTVCGGSHAAGAAIQLEVDLTVALETESGSQVGYSVTTGAGGNQLHYLVSWVGGCDQFGPCDRRPDQFATYTFHVTHPAALRVACPGTITAVSATETSCEFTHAGGPTYSTFGLAAYPSAAWVPGDKGAWGSATVTMYDRPGSGMTEAVDATHHAGMVAWMEGQFGPYPYGTELRVLSAPTYWAGFEHPGNIVLDDALARNLTAGDRYPVAHTLDHEIAHQWAGDQTTLADTYDFVWKEAMAEYLTFAFEDTLSAVTSQRTASSWKAGSVGAQYFPVPAEQPALFEFYGDVYGPGPMILFRQLEVLSSRAQVLAALQSVLGAPRALSVPELLAALATSTGLDLDAYAAAWIHGTGAPTWPTARTTFTPAAGTSTLRVEIVAGTERRCKFHVALRGAAPEDSVEVAVDTFRNGTDQTIDVPTPAFTVTQTVLDPDRECLVYPATGAIAGPRPRPWLSERGRAAAPARQAQ